MKQPAQANKLLWTGLAFLLSAIPLFMIARVIAAMQHFRFTPSAELVIIFCPMIAAI